MIIDIYKKKRKGFGILNSSIIATEMQKRAGNFIHTNMTASFIFDRVNSNQSQMVCSRDILCHQQSKVTQTY